ncbi:MAG TPA: serine/threonine-protein kinase, partial [Nannocystaceae bacterium]|nr:serine/threonine-protein kinase [Nannocystaceae bacterium]
MTGAPPSDSKSAMEDTVPADPSELPKPAAPVEPLVRGTAVGRYTVLDRIGAGGMGVVYAAFDPELDRRIALKVLHPGGSGSVGTTDGRNRLLREAQAMAKLHHPNVITVHDVGTLGDRVFVAMEFVDGHTLREWLKQGVREWPEIVDVFVRAGRGLAAAHAAGLVHRDFKPDNVLVGNDGRVLVMDFGLARQAGTPALLDGSSGSRLVPVPPVSDTSLTRTGAVLGTPAYMAPEQHAGGSIGAAVDQFSFCVALYEALWGDRPFAGNSVASLAIAVLEGKPKLPPKDSDVPSWLFTVISRGLAVEANDRFPSMDVLLAELQRDPPKTGRPAVAIGVAIGVAAMIVAAYLLSRPDPTASCRAELDGIGPLLDDASVGAIDGAFGATGLDYASMSLQSTKRELSALDSSWRSSWIALCEASRARPGTATAFAGSWRCLEDLRAEAGALLGELGHAGAPEVQRAVAAAQQLPSPEHCTRVGPLAPSEGTAGGRSVDELRASL